MTPTLKLMLALATVLGVAVTTVNSKPPESQNKICDGKFEKNQLQNDAQKALDDIGSERTLTDSNNLAKRGQHVFNNNLIKFHRSVLKDLLRKVGGSEQLDNLVKDLVIPLSEDNKNKIGTDMVVYISPKDEQYKDYNSVVYGAYGEKLRGLLVEYLEADTSDDKMKKKGMESIKTEVETITKKMVKHIVYVDAMACDYWLKENKETKKKTKQFQDILAALENMFKDILKSFETVSKKIKGFRKNKSWIR